MLSGVDEAASELHSAFFSLSWRLTVYFYSFLQSISAGEGRAQTAEMRLRVWERGKAPIGLRWHHPVKIYCWKEDELIVERTVSESKVRTEDETAAERKNLKTLETRSGLLLQEEDVPAVLERDTRFTVSMK